MASSPRPLSPHLQVYRFTLTMAMSIAQRITGVANYVGTLLLVLWLVAAAIGGGLFDGVNAFFGSWIGQVILFGYTWSLFHHMLGGIRYLVWDTRRGLDPVGREAITQLQVYGAIVLTIGAWIVWVWFK